MPHYNVLVVCIIFIGAFLKVEQGGGSKSEFGVTLTRITISSSPILMKPKVVACRSRLIPRLLPSSMSNHAFDDLLANPCVTFLPNIEESNNRGMRRDLQRLEPRFARSPVKVAS